MSRAMLKGLEKRKHNLEAKLEKVEYAIKSRTEMCIRDRNCTSYYGRIQKMIRSISSAWMP